MSKDAVNNFYINNEKEKSFFEKLFKKVEKYRNDMLDNKNSFMSENCMLKKRKSMKRQRDFQKLLKI